MKLECIKLKCESMEDFLIKVNKRLDDLGSQAQNVQIISNDYRPETLAIITINEGLIK